MWRSPCDVRYYWLQLRLAGLNMDARKIIALRRRRSTTFVLGQVPILGLGRYIGAF